MRFRAKMVGVALSRRRMLFLKKILFTYLAAWHLSHGTQSLHCVMQDSSLQCKGSLVVVKGLLSSCSSWAQLLCIPHQGWNLHPHIARQILNHWTTGEVARMLFVSEMAKRS